MAVDLEGTDAGTLVCRKRFTLYGQHFEPGQEVPSTLNQEMVEKLRRVGKLVHRSSGVGKRLLELRTKSKRRK